jgi:hypothetical protein
MNITSLSPTQLRKAADIQERIESLQNELNEILGGDVLSPAQTIEAPKRRKFSAAAKARMRAAQQARWAKIKGTTPSATPAPKQKGKMSAQGLANIRAAQKARWAKRKGTASTTPTPSAKPAQKPKKKLSAQGIANIRAGVGKRMAARAKALKKSKI